MRLLVDADALSKLAHWSVLADTPSVLGCSVSDCATIASLQYRAKRSLDQPDGKLFKSTEAAAIALSTIESMGSLAGLDEESLAAFEDVSGIDPGEALLFAEAMVRPETFVLTGDKRALRALSALSAPIREKLAGRVIIIEQALLRLLDSYGLPWLRERVCPMLSIDRAVGAIMGSRCDASELSVRDGMASYIREISELYEPTLLAALSPLARR